MVAGEEDLRDAGAAEVFGTGVLGVFEEAGGEGVVGRGGLVAEDAGEEAGDGVEDDEGGELAAAEYVVADRELLVDVGFDAFVEALVAGADQ